eukprot:4114-Alexandrium_andersonii.AAC.1
MTEDVVHATHEVPTRKQPLQARLAPVLSAQSGQDPLQDISLCHEQLVATHLNGLQKRLEHISVERPPTLHCGTAAAKDEGPRPRAWKPHIIRPELDVLDPVLRTQEAHHDGKSGGLELRHVLMQNDVREDVQHLPQPTCKRNDAGAKEPLAAAHEGVVDAS